MPTRSRFRRATKWIGTTLSLAAACIWILSLVLSVEYRKKKGSGLTIEHGLIEIIQRIPNARPTPFYFFPDSYRRGWSAELILGHRSLGVRMPRKTYDDGQIRKFRVPIWIPFAIVILPTLLLWIPPKKYPPGHCRGCGYNLTANESGKCPECGTPIPNSEPAAPIQSRAGN